MERDTIAALATASGPGAIAIIRLSGPESLMVADRLFRGPAPRPSERAGGVFAHGRIVQPGTAGHEEQTADDVLLLIFRAPHSYTGEEMVEIHCHGGRHMPHRVLHAVLAAGARPAEPGEFTRRAFLNGKMDLTQAEAVADLIGAATDRSARAALEQLQGRLRGRIDALYDGVLQAAAGLEATLDFPEDELPTSAVAAVAAGLETVRRDIQTLLATRTEGHLLRDGLRVVISGSPNVGKSTLLNALLGRDRAIVSPVPGTTRDVIEENLALDGILLRLTDTAGLRASDCVVEREGVRRSRAQMEAADLHLHVVDASRPLTPGERAEAAALPPADTIIVWNKCDLAAGLPVGEPAEFRRVRTSLLHGHGLDELRTAIAAHLAERAPSGTVPQAVIAERHYLLLREAAAHIQATLALWEAEGEDRTVCAATELRAAAQALGAITGRVYHDELLDRIFSRFCIGK